MADMSPESIISFRAPISRLSLLSETEVVELTASTNDKLSTYTKLNTVHKSYHVSPIATEIYLIQVDKFRKLQSESKLLSRVQ